MCVYTTFVPTSIRPSPHTRTSTEIEHTPVCMSSSSSAFWVSRADLHSFRLILSTVLLAEAVVRSITHEYDLSSIIWLLGTAAVTFVGGWFVEALAITIMDIVATPGSNYTSEPTPRNAERQQQQQQQQQLPRPQHHTNSRPPPLTYLTPDIVIHTQEPLSCGSHTRPYEDSSNHDVRCSQIVEATRALKRSGSPASATSAPPLERRTYAFWGGGVSR